MTRRLATWSFAILVIGGAALDATVLSKEPEREQANVTVQSPDEPLSVARAIVENQDMIEVADAQRGVNPFAPKVRFLDPGEPRPGTRIPVDGMTWKVVHTRDQVGMPIELHAPAGCIVHIGAQVDPAPLRAFVPDGRYAIWSSCDPAGTPVTRLEVVRDSP